MPKPLSIVSVIEKNRLSSETPFLILLKIVVVDPISGGDQEVMYLAKNNEDVVYQGNTYVASNFNIELKQEAGTLPEIQLSIVDFTRAVQQRMQAYGGGVGFKVTVGIVNAGALSEPPEIQEFFEVVGASASDYAASFTLGAESGLARTFPRRRQFRDFCGWKYKGAQCGYVGTKTSCDLTLQGPNGCDAHGNSLNFGGFPGLNPRNGNFG